MHVRVVCGSLAQPAYMLVNTRVKVLQRRYVGVVMTIMHFLCVFVLGCCAVQGVQKRQRRDARDIERLRALVAAEDQEKQQKDDADAAEAAKP